VREGRNLQMLDTRRIATTSLGLDRGLHVRGGLVVMGGRCIATGFGLHGALRVHFVVIDFDGHFRNVGGDVRLRGNQVYGRWTRPHRTRG
jgi:hypothetical protein